MAAILHKVRVGESILSICLLYGISYERFLKLNKRFMGLSDLDGFCTIVLKPGARVAVGDSADPIDLIRILGRKGQL